MAQGQVHRDGQDIVKRLVGYLHLVPSVPCSCERLLREVTSFFPGPCDDEHGPRDPREMVAVEGRERLSILVCPVHHASVHTLTTRTHGRARRLHLCS